MIPCKHCKLTKNSYKVPETTSQISPLCDECLDVLIIRPLLSRYDACLSEIHKISEQIEAVNLIKNPTSKKFRHEFICTCGTVFDSYLSREIHQDESPNPASHRLASEVIGDHIVSRDRTKVGDPIVKRRKPPKVPTTDIEL